MKRKIFLGITLILLVLSVYFLGPRIISTVKTTEQLVILIVFLISFLLFFIALYIVVNSAQRDQIGKLKSRLATWTKLSYHVSQVGDEVFNELPIGIVALDDNYEIKWTNVHAKVIFNQKITERPLLEVNKELYDVALKNEESAIIPIQNEIYDITYKADYKFFYLFNVTDREQIKKRYNEQIPALGILYLDNLDESLAGLDVSEQSSIKGEYLAAIADWAAKYDCYIKPYSDERIVFIGYRKQLDEMIKDKFDILDQVRNISIKNEVRISLSIGIASWDLAYEELGIYAQNAIELAEKRGGDQVVVNIQNEKIAYFGAKLDALAKNSRVGARINAQTISDLIGKAEEIFIMGHNQADLDAFGSMIAAGHMARISKKPVYLIVDEEKLDTTVQKIYHMLQVEQPDLLDRMITTEQGLKYVTKESVLIVVDTQSPKMVISPRMLEAVQNVIVIDHHRVGEESFDAIFSYVEPYASSSIELVMELLNFYPEEASKFKPMEATIMYGGLVVDTNNFTYRTGSRTFEVAQKLKESGADTAAVKTWLRKDLHRTMAINKLLSTVEVYLNRFAFVVSDDILSDRILLAQVSDEALQISDVDASFTIGKLNDGTVGVSARSYQSVNVQLLMEALGGGGHLNSAAAQIQDENVEQVVKRIKEILELEYGQGGDMMKIILLEDVKGRGKKDDVIEVANGYGQFLITHNKAVAATDEQIEKLRKAKEDEQIALQKHVDMMNKIKAEIEGKNVTLSIQLGQDGKMFGSITTKQIVEAFEEQNGIHLDKKKVMISSEINSIGIYPATVDLYRDIKAQFEVHIIEK